MVKLGEEYWGGIIGKQNCLGFKGLEQKGHYAIFRCSAAKYIKDVQFSDYWPSTLLANLNTLLSFTFMKVKFFPYFACREQTFHLLSFSKCSITPWFSIATQTAVLCAPSKAEYNKGCCLCNNPGHYFFWLVSSCALQLGPQTTHPAALQPSSDPSGNMALMVACLT